VAYKVLIINPRAEELEEEVRELEARGLPAVGATTYKEAYDLLVKDGRIHVILTEWILPLKKRTKETVAGAELFSRFLAVRYEVNIFLFTHETDCATFNTGGLINGYFHKGEESWDDIASKVRAEVISSKDRAPFFDALVAYAQAAKDAWHTPGHSSGDSVKNSEVVGDYLRFFGENLFQSDVSVSVPALDSLLEPKGVIKEAQELAARAFNARYTYFTTNGTSTSNKVLIQTLLKPGDAILLDRNCHKSVHYGVIVAGAEPLYLMPSVNNRYGIFGPVPKARIIASMDAALAAGKRLKVLILTNCTYDGLIYDIKDIVEQAHARGIKVIVDEAWFGYANFHRAFYPSAMAAGADYSTQSTHKTMSAFSQASMIHVQDPEFESIREFFQENFNMQASTSPQYPMIASLDVARRQMAMEGYALLQRTLEMAAALKKSINSLKKFRVLELEDLISDEVREDGIRLDPTKLTIDVSGSGCTSKEIEYLLLTKHNIQIEKSTFNTITVLITIGSTYSKLNRLVLALANIQRMSGARRESGAARILEDFSLSLSPIRFLPRYAFYAEGESVPMRDAAGRVATAMVVPYPPGIPLLVPGQIITEDIVNTLMTYRDYGVEIHGASEGLVKVMLPAEEERLVRQGREMVPLAVG